MRLLSVAVTYDARRLGAWGRAIQAFALACVLATSILPASADEPATPAGGDCIVPSDRDLWQEAVRLSRDDPKQQGQNARACSSDGIIQEAKQGCCSHHGGVCGCNSSTGHQLCCDGADSPSCGC